MTKRKRSSLNVKYDPSKKPEPWLIVERSEYGLSVLKAYKTEPDARRALHDLRKSAVPRLALLFPFGTK